MVDQVKYPRVTLKCNCGNQFDVNVIRMKNKESVLCQVCGKIFPVETGEQFAQAFEDLYKVKYQLEKESNNFQFAFLYKSTFAQPPVPYMIDQDMIDIKLSNNSFF